MKITGTCVNYYFHCKRQLWFFSNQIGMEQTSELVAIGKVISETAYENKNREIYASEDEFEFVIDFFDHRTNNVHEVKKTYKMEILHIWQVRFYMYRLKEMGFKDIKGIIDYPKLKKRIKVELKPEDEEILKKTFEEIRQIVKLKIPPKVIYNKSFRKCSYFELCYT